MSPLFRSVKVRRERGSAIELHAHDESQLIYVAAGSIQVHTTVGRWHVPTSMAVWVPTSMPHRIEVLNDSELGLIFWSSTATADWAPPGLYDRAFALEVTQLLRELFEVAALEDPSSMRTELAVRLILQELTVATDAPTFLPLPTSVVGRRIAGVMLSDLRNRCSLEQLASRSVTSPRTISRLFPLETGLTFKVWRQRARIVAAIERLAAGASIKRVTYETGFSNTAAFAFAFRQVTLMTPTEFLSSRIANADVSS